MWPLCSNTSLSAAVPHPATLVSWPRQGSDTWALIEEYVRTTHGKTHTAYTLEVLDVLEVAREGEKERFLADIGNRALLWHPQAPPTPPPT